MQGTPERDEDSNINRSNKKRRNAEQASEDRQLMDNKQKVKQAE